MDINMTDFNFEKFLVYKEEKNKKFKDFIDGKTRKIPLINQPDSFHWTDVCKTREGSLDAQLEYLKNCMITKSDLAFTYIEPWYGVGLYAAAFGCKYEFHDGESPQTRPIYESTDEIQNLKKPDIKKCEEMIHVLDMIKYFREKTGGYIDISLTDTQSTNDTASLILDPCELFMAALSEPELVEPFLTQVTDLIIEFTEIQMEAIGSDLALPGHIMLCGKSLSGIAIADDNMAFLSPAAYENSAFNYNCKLSKHFGGISIHTCGNASANLKKLAETPDLFMVDLALGTAVDPSPNDPLAVVEAFSGKDTIVKVKAGDMELSKLKPLVESDVKMIIELRMTGSIDERNKKFEESKEKIEKMSEGHR